MHQNIEAIDYKEETEDIIRKFERKEDFVYYTSGSTGKPKKIVHSYELMKMVAEENCRYNNYAKHDYIVNMSLPAASIGYPVLSVLPALISGCKLKVRAFNPYDYLDEIKEATHAFILPAVYRVLKKTTKWITFNFTGMTISCGADIVPEGIKDDVLSKGAIKFHHLLTIYLISFIPALLLFIIKGNAPKFEALFFIIIPSFYLLFYVYQNQIFFPCPQ